MSEIKTEILLMREEYLTLNNMEKEKKEPIVRAKKIGQFGKYEVWVDKYNFMTIVDGVHHYYTSLYNLIYKLNIEVNQKTIRDADLNNLAKELRKNEELFEKNIKNSLDEIKLDIGDTDSEDYLKLKEFHLERYGKGNVRSDSYYKIKK